MTHKQFEKSRLIIESEPFTNDSSEPLPYGIARRAFECRKFERLIALAKAADGQTASNKLKAWKRQLERSIAAKARLERLRAEIELTRFTSFPIPSGQGR